MKTLLTLLFLLFSITGYGAGTVVKTITPAPQNYLINGGFDHFQRVNVDGNGYHADRWYRTAGTTTKVTSSLPTGQRFGIQLALSSQAGWLCQRVERDNIRVLYNQKMTISGYVKSTSGTSSLQFKADYPNTEDSWGGVGSNGTSLTSDISVQTLLASTSSTWTKFQYTFTVSANAATYGVQVCLGNSGSSTTNTYQFSSITLNEGSAPLPFRMFGYTIDKELQSCLRYYEKTFQDTDAPSGTSAYAIMYGVGSGGGGSSYITINLVPKRNENYTVTYYHRSLANNAWTQECANTTHSSPYMQGDQKKTKTFFSFTNSSSCGGYSSYIVFGHIVFDNEL